MHSTLARSALIVAVALLPACVTRSWPTPTPAGASSSIGVARLNWLSGCWRQLRDDRVIEEQWSDPRAGMLMGMSRTLRGDSVVSFEFTRIVERGDGVVFIASPSGQGTAEFVSTALSDTAVVFENPAHDFPRRVRYASAGAGTLVARVDNPGAAASDGQDFRYTRVACPTGAPGS